MNERSNERTDGWIRWAKEKKKEIQREREKEIKN